MVVMKIWSEILLQKVMKLFRDLDEKDVFGSHYKKHMAKRILSYESKYDEDAERNMIRKLKVEWSGLNFVCSSFMTSNTRLYIASLTFKQIQEEVGIPTSDLKLCLESLTLLKWHNVLKKSSVGKDVISEDDMFFYKEEFSSKHRKLKFKMVVRHRNEKLKDKKLRSWKRNEKEKREYLTRNTGIGQEKQARTDSQRHVTV
nr:cullin 3B [Tanacetum cinerariifolium]